MPYKIEIIADIKLHGISKVFTPRKSDASCSFSTYTYILQHGTTIHRARSHTNTHNEHSSLAHTATTHTQPETAMRTYHTETDSQSRNTLTHRATENDKHTP